MTQYGFYFDSSRCTGCKTCELVCKDYHDLGPGILFRRVYDYEGGAWARKDEETGLVNSDPAVCIGCGTCRSACPYDAPRIDADSNVSRKCDGCLARVREDEEPMCVGACPLRALEFGPIEELREKHGDLAQIPPMPEPSTSPNIVIGSCQAIDSDAYDVGEGYVANPLEVE